MNYTYSVLDNTEKLIYTLRSLYSRYGYSQYRMSKFEEYDLYGKNKDFLVSDSVITFTDTTGKLMALKPDVTLSVIKNTRDNPGTVQKLCYNENVYRVSKGTGAFKEIMQAGLECIGDVDGYCLGEVLWLAAESLAEIFSDFVLDISHLGVLSAFVDFVTDNAVVKDKIIGCAGAKNLHGISEICRDNGIGEEKYGYLLKLLSLSGTPSAVLPEMIALCAEIGASEQAEELKSALSIFDRSELKSRLRIDFSVICDMNYYNGVVFSGFVEGVPGSVLSGGQYDRLMKKMGRNSCAVGFAIYLDMLERLSDDTAGYDADIMLVYCDDVSPEEIRGFISQKIAEGKTVYASRNKNSKIKYRQLIEIGNGEVKILENNA